MRDPADGGPDATRGPDGTRGPDVTRDPDATRDLGPSGDRSLYRDRGIHPAPQVSRRRLIAGAAGLGALAAGGTAAWRLTTGDEPRVPDRPGGTVPDHGGAATSAPSGSSRKIPRGLLSIFGAPGTFGDLDGSSPIGTVEVPGWGFGPGQAAYMSAVAADGTVFIATTPFTDDQSKLTGTGMELGLFEPAQPRFSRLVIPSSTGRQTQPRAELLFSGIGGGDVSDVQVVPAPAGEQG
ncbi:hypothetical protein UG55_11281, partial [Frankia sp. EI5c]